MYRLITALGIIIGALLLVAGVVFVQEAERRVPVQYSKKVQGRKMVGAQSTHIPLKLVMAGVMPVWFRRNKKQVSRVDTCSNATLCISPR